MVKSEVGGADLGYAFDLLLKAVTEGDQKVNRFKSSLSHIETTISIMKPILIDMDMLNRVRHQYQKELSNFVDLLIKGEKLVRKCLVMKSWKIIKRYTYANKLDQLENSLIQLWRVIALAGVCSYREDILVEVTKNSEKLDKITSILSFKGFSGCCNVPLLPEFVIGFNYAVEEVKEMLLNSDEQAIVISAPGGCGKTTLAIKLCNDHQIKGLYEENIFFLFVSKSPNPRHIVQKVFQSKNCIVPQFKSDEDAVSELEKFVRNINKPVLLVLDDVWSGSESMIKDFNFKIPGYKMLITSRFVFPVELYCTYKLEVLNEDDAASLFNYSAFKDERSHVRNSLVNKVMKSCGGFPLALKVVGQSLRREPEVVWAQRIQTTFFTKNKDIFECLKPSIDALDENLKECFLDLASFPKDENIPCAALNDMWDEEDTQTIQNLFQLSIANLIHNLDHTFLMQHSLLRELAIYLTTQDIIHQRRRLIIQIIENQLPKWWTQQNHHDFQAKLLSVTTDETFSSIWPDINLPSLELLVINFCTEIYSLPKFIEKTSLLKVMIITNNGFSPAKLYNSPFFGNLVSLKKIRLEYILFSSIYESLLQLKNLQKLSLITCEIGNAFENCTLEISTMWPNLEEINIEYCHDLVELPVSLCNLICLKKLCITYCDELVKLPEEIGNLTSLEVLSLKSCTKLFLLPESIGSLGMLRELDISDCVGINHLPMSIGELYEIRIINIKGCNGLYELPYQVTKLMQLQVVVCDAETALMWEYYQKDSRNLKISVPKQDINLRWLHKSLA